MHRGYYKEAGPKDRGLPQPTVAFFVPYAYEYHVQSLLCVLCICISELKSEVNDETGERGVIMLKGLNWRGRVSRVRCPKEASGPNGERVRCLLFDPQQRDVARLAYLPEILGCGPEPCELIGGARWSGWVRTSDLRGAAAQ